MGVDRVTLKRITSNTISSLLDPASSHCGGITLFGRSVDDEAVVASEASGVILCLVIERSPHAVWDCVVDLLAGAFAGGLAHDGVLPFDAAGEAEPLSAASEDGVCLEQAVLQSGVDARLVLEKPPGTTSTLRA